jgi:hypothetical protein
LKQIRGIRKIGIPPAKWLPAALWKKIVNTMPIPCVDVIFQRADNAILYGWRLIPPYKGVWAFLGGRIVRGENLTQTATRIAQEYGLGFRKLYLNGVFPVTFSTRSDIAISLVATEILGEPRVDGFEFSKYVWSKRPPLGTGRNYRRMVTHWMHACKSDDFLRLNRLL